MEYKFTLEPHEKKWFHWQEINECFWPAAGKRSLTINHKLEKIVNAGGVYCIGWGKVNGVPSVVDKHIKYIGQTSNYKNRMGQFATSAGIFYNKRYTGHSAGWRWPKGYVKHLHIAFFPVLDDTSEYIKKGLMFLNEGLAFHEFHQKHGKLPEVNLSKKELFRFKKS